MSKGSCWGCRGRFALRSRKLAGFLRSDCIWHKPNAMPSACKTRPTTDHEYIFFFSRSKDYFYDADAIREPHVTFSENSKMKGGRNHFGKRKRHTGERKKTPAIQICTTGVGTRRFIQKGRNKRTVWSISLSKCREAHFAVYPESLVETCIKATCPEGGIVFGSIFRARATTACCAAKLSFDFSCNRLQSRLSQNRQKAVE